MTTFLHIGTPKTGTSSFQTYCSDHRRELADIGFLYPTTLGKVAHTGLALYAANYSRGFAGRRLEGVTSEADLAVHRAGVKESLIKEVEASTADNIIISSEHLYASVTSVEEIARIKELLRPIDPEIRIIVYMREVDDCRRSLYNESIRMGNSGSFAEFSELERTKRLLDYRQALANWSEVFGDAALTAKRYERSALVGNDIVVDLLTAVGAGSVLEQAPVAGMQGVRESLDEEALAFLLQFNGVIGELTRKDSRAFIQHLRSAGTREAIATALTKAVRSPALAMSPSGRKSTTGAGAGEGAAPPRAGQGDELGPIDVSTAIRFAAQLWLEQEKSRLAIDPAHAARMESVAKGLTG